MTDKLKAAADRLIDGADSPSRQYWGDLDCGPKDAMDVARAYLALTDAMTIYVVLLQDRHTDPELFLFGSPESALAKCRDIIEEYGFEPEAAKEEGPLVYKIPMGRRLSSESDYVTVLVKGVMT